jgi:murein DD-endopeptidase MepM/ murein hydrolase activator NlpD
MVKLKDTRLFRNFRSKYRLVVQDENNFEEKFALRLSRANVFSIISGVFLTTALLVVLIIVFTPLREFIPGYPDNKIREMAIRTSLVVDSLEHEIAMQQNYLNVIRNVLQGNVEEDSVNVQESSPINTSNIVFSRSVEDSLMRLRLETEIEYSLAVGSQKSRRRNIDLATTVFFPPLRGTVTDVFNLNKGHFGIDIVSTKDAPVKATLPGIVILSSWTADAGNVISIQHENELISVYKHNAVLLKKQGDKVKAGETIGIVGNSGEYSTGPHLHFELWHKGKPIDPAKYMSF